MSKLLALLLFPGIDLPRIGCWNEPAGREARVLFGIAGNLVVRAAGEEGCENTAAFGEPHATRIPDVRKLDRILAGLQVDSGPKSLWQLFDDWVHERWREFVKSLSDIPNPLAGLKWHWPDWASEFDTKTWAQFFLKFVLSHPAVTVATPATSQARNMVDNLAGGVGRLPDEAMRKRMVAFVDALPSA